MSTHWFVASVAKGMDIDLEDAPECMRCSSALTPAICAEEFVDTGICSDCWTSDDEETCAS
jgi:hypothetical protein